MTLMAKGFNSSQVGYKLPELGLLGLRFRGFQFLIGRLQTVTPGEHLRVIFTVSIPHRQATNLKFCSGLKSIIHVSIPHRQATNSNVRCHFITSITGFNSSQVGYKRGQLVCTASSLGGFQFLIGRLQTIPGEDEEDTEVCFNSSQVGYKPYPCFFPKCYRCSFNSSQVGYKHRHNSLLPHIRLVSIPHRQATNYVLRYVDILQCHVSIPHRQATNVVQVTGIGRRNDVSIPHRQATNFLGTVWVFSVGQFQFLIGRLQTRPYLNYIDTASMFQFLIGRLQTRMATEGRGGQVCVSIPHRQATNPALQFSVLFLDCSFNSSQVGYKLYARVGEGDRF